MTITANYPVPLNQAVMDLAVKYGWQVNFEQAPCINPPDLVDDTAPKWRLAHPGEKGVMRPAGGLFVSSVPLVTDRSDSAIQAQVLSKLVSDYNASDNPGKYALIAGTAGQFTVVGVEVRSKAGQLERVTPVLDTTISLERVDRTIRASIEAIVAAVSLKAGIQMMVVGGPNYFDTITLTAGGENISARQLLEQALAASQRHFQYNLLFDSNVPGYGLNISPVVILQPGPHGPVPKLIDGPYRPPRGDTN